jgi:outer membrane protein with beta-barrel domain
MRATFHLFTAGVLLALGVPCAAAQHPQTRQGFWIGFGFGGGSARFSCNGCTDTTLTAATGHVKLGGTVRPNLLIGGELNAWTKNQNSETLTIGNVSAIVQYYPAVASGFFLKGGVGFATISDKNTGATATGNGFGYIVGLGYDFRVARNFSLTPIANVYYGGIGELTTAGSTTSGLGWKQSVFELGLDFMFH